jgi:hypothetical protein
VLFFNRAMNWTRLCGLGKREKSMRSLVLAMHETTNRIEAKQKQIERLNISVLSLAKTNRAEALLQLKKRKKLDAQVAIMHKSLEALDDMYFKVEQMELTRITISAIKDVTKLMKSMNINVEEAEKVMDDASDVMTAADEVSTAVASDITKNDSYGDDDDLMKELDDLLKSDPTKWKTKPVREEDVEANEDEELDEPSRVLEEQRSLLKPKQKRKHRESHELAIL